MIPYKYISLHPFNMSRDKWSVEFVARFIAYILITSSIILRNRKLSTSLNTKYDLAQSVGNVSK